MNNPEQTAFGQYGSKLATSGSPATPDDGFVFVALTALNEAALVTNTAAESGFTCPVSMPLPTGVTVYGRWTNVTVDSADQVICYQGK